MCFLAGTPFIAAEEQSITELKNAHEDVIVLQDGSQLRGCITKIPVIKYPTEEQSLSINDISEITFTDGKFKINSNEGNIYTADIPPDTFSIVQYLPNRANPKYSMQKEVPAITVKYLTFKQKQQDFIALKSLQEKINHLEATHTNDVESSYNANVQIQDLQKANHELAHELQETKVKFKNIALFAQALEAQLQTITTRAIALGDEFTKSTQAYHAIENKVQYLEESNKHLEHEHAIASNHLTEERERNLSLQEGIISMTEKARKIDEELSHKEEVLAALQETYQKEIAHLTDSHTSNTAEYHQEFDKLIAALDAERNENDTLRSQVTQLQNQSVAGNPKEEIAKLKNERDTLAAKYKEEHKQLLDQSVLVERLSEIARIQKNTLERIERSRVALSENEQEGTE